MTNAKANAKSKTAKVQANAKSEAQTVEANQAQAVQAVFIASANARMVDAEKCKTIISDLNEFSKPEFIKTLDAIVSRGLLTFEDLQTLAQNLAVTDKQDARFIGLKVITKVRQALYSFAVNLRQFDGYTNAILSNLARLQELSNKSALVSLSKSIEYHEDEQTADIKRLLNCSIGTASTQASSTRMMLKALNVCNVQKRKAKDVISFTDSKTAQAVQMMYA